MHVPHTSRPHAACTGRSTNIEQKGHWTSCSWMPLELEGGMKEDGERGCGDCQLGGAVSSSRLFPLRSPPHFLLLEEVALRATLSVVYPLEHLKRTVSVLVF